MFRWLGHLWQDVKAWFSGPPTYPRPTEPEFKPSPPKPPTAAVPPPPPVSEWYGKPRPEPEPERRREYGREYFDEEVSFEPGEFAEPGQLGEDITSLDDLWNLAEDYELSELQAQEYHGTGDTGKRE